MTASLIREPLILSLLGDLLIFLELKRLSE